MGDGGVGMRSELVRVVAAVIPIEGGNVDDWVEKVIKASKRLEAYAQGGKWDEVLDQLNEDRLANSSFAAPDARKPSCGC